MSWNILGELVPRRLEPTDPVIVELREWSRLSQDLTQKRVRLANWMREPLWIAKDVGSKSSHSRI